MMVHGLETMAALNEAAVDDASAPPSIADRYESYRLVGELYGRLRDALGWGDLTMSTERQGEVLYRWMITAKGQGYAVTHCVSPRDLRTSTDAETIAAGLSNQWKNQLRRTVGERIEAE